MKLRYDFEMVQLDDVVVAVPVGTGQTDFHEVIKLNSTAARVFELLKEDISEELLLEKLCIEYSDTSKEQINDYMHDFISVLSEKGVLE